MSVIACASATWAAVTLLRPMWRISPLRRSSASTVTVDDRPGTRRCNPEVAEPVFDKLALRYRHVTGAFCALGPPDWRLYGIGLTSRTPELRRNTCFAR